MPFSVLIGITNHTCAASLSHSYGLRFTMLLVFKGASTPTKVHPLLKYSHPYPYSTVRIVNPTAGSAAQTQQGVILSTVII